MIINTGNLTYSQPCEMILHQLQFDDQRFQVNALKDTQQFYDPQALALQAGIPSSTWSLFGNIWPSGMILAALMQSYELADTKVLEMDCGLGLASIGNATLRCKCDCP